MSHAADEPILLLHGQPGSARDWDGVAAAIGPRSTTLAIDRPGWDRRSAATGLAGNAKAASRALDTAGVARATVVGHSFGGAVAAALAVREPARVARLVLVAPAANVASLYRIDHWLAAPAFGALAGVAMLGALGGALALPPLRGRIAGAAGIDERYLGAAGRRLLSPAAWRAFAYEQRALVAELPALERRLPEITAPTTIVSGTADRVVPAASIRQLATQIPSAELRWLRDAGHLVLQQRGSALAEIVLEAIPSPAAARARPA